MATADLSKDSLSVRCERHGAGGSAGRARALGERCASEMAAEAGGRLALRWRDPRAGDTGVVVERHTL